jgi:glycerol uptake facilitator-like aquaporin
MQPAPRGPAGPSGARESKRTSWREACHIPAGLRTVYDAETAMRLFPPLLRDDDIGDHTERFLVAAVATVLVVRAILALTHYPSRGGGRLHIAHMLWGGLLLTFALGMVFSTVNRQVRPFAAFVGGAGFGLFIDELGKFLTRDNDYFYQPTFAVMYLVFVALFLFFRWVDEHTPLSPVESMANSLTLMQDMLVGDFDPIEKERARAYLACCDPKDPSVVLLREFLDNLQVVRASRPGWYVRGKAWARKHVEPVIRTRHFPELLAIFFFGQALFAISTAATAGAWAWMDWRAGLTGSHLPSGVADWGRLVSSLVAGFFVMRGMFRLGRSRERAYADFRRALLVSIFVTQFFVFYRRQLAGLTGLAVNLPLLGATNYLLARERHRKEARQATRADAPAKPAA